MRDNHEDSDLQSDDDGAALPQSLSGRVQVNEPQNQSVEGELAEILDGPTVEAHVELAVTPRESVLTFIVPFPSDFGIRLCTQCPHACPRPWTAEAPYDDSRVPPRPTPFSRPQPS